MRGVAAAAALVGATAVLRLPCAAAEVFFEESFRDADWETRWVHSTWKGGNGPAGKFEWSAGNWFADEDEQKGLRTPNNMNYHGISSKLSRPFSTRGKTLVLQFSVKHESQEFSFCGGGYIKLLSTDFDQAKFGGKTPYKVMFGPDICGYDVARIHAILTYQDKNLLREPDIRLEYDDKNEYTHLYTLVIKPDNTYQVLFDLKERAAGSLHEHWAFPNRTRDDPADKKPQDWVDVKRIDDPAKKKPQDWVDARRIRDPEASQPAEWDVDEDGIWESPMIDNPKYKGEWFPEKIDNPLYKGDWRPRQLANPDFVEDVYPLDDVGGIGFELWTVNKGSIFDNILLCDSLEHAKSVGERLLGVFAKEKDAKKAWLKANGKEEPEAPPEEDEDEEDFGGGKEEL
eukprot:SRR837773.19597.p1 GENE.SRR837773.19597~~SRR837773.19597.p1  ORF type:complete len:400 (-),score=166.39 SRR837773.19597:7-1206(-)